MKTAQPILVGLAWMSARVRAGARLVSRENRSTRTRTAIACFRPLLFASLGSVLAGQVPAETFTVLHTFSAAPWPAYTNSDGATPIGDLILLGNTLYGTAAEGGDSGNGTLFSLSTSSTNLATLHNFTGLGAVYGSELIGSGDPFYGTTASGGSMGYGTVFKVNADGTDLTPLHTFIVPNGEGGDGAYPSKLVLSGNILYGVTGDLTLGGGVGWGTIFKLNTDGTGFANLYRFKNDGDGAIPIELVLSGRTLYGAASGNFDTNNGTVFSMNIDGTGFQVLHSFSSIQVSSTNSNGISTNVDGSIPTRLLLSGNTLYGITWVGGSGGNGTVFKLNTDGTDFRIIHDFAASTGSDPQFQTNNDGGGPSDLTLSKNMLYGTASWGGLYGNGTIFSVNTNGSLFQVFHHFSAISTNQNGIYTNCDGASPEGLLLSGNSLYGTTSWGGTGGNGTIFSISFTPQLSLTPSGPNIILSWPTGYVGFDYSAYILQSTTNLASPVWTTNLPAPAVVNGQSTLTHPISGIQQFFRLSQWRN